MILKRTALTLLFFISFLHSSMGQEILFPQVILKNIPTEVIIQSDENIEFITVNGERLPVNKLGKNYATTITLSDQEIHISEKYFEYETPIVIPGWLSLLPPLIAIVLALIFKEVLSSLFIGVFIGAATYGFYTGGFTGIFTAFFTVIDTYIINSLMDSGHLSVIVFSILIGSIVAIISKNGGMQGVVNLIVKYATTRRSGMFATYLMGLAIFFDDYANSLVVGNTMRPITDKLKISREKLAYIVDSTAAPIVATAFITTWIGAELTYISDGIEKIELQHGIEFGTSAYGIFLNSLSFAFYSIFTLIFMFILIYLQKDYGPMWKAELKALRDGIKEDNVVNRSLEEFNPVKKARLKAYNAVIPILIVVIGTIAGLFITGISASQTSLLAAGVDISGGVWSAIGTEDGQHAIFFKKLGIVIGNADSYVSLLWSSLAGLTTAIFMTLGQRIMSLKEVMDAFLIGVNTMMPAMLILVLAWALADVTTVLSTAEYLKSFFSNDFNSIWIIPALTFVLSGLISFSTGSSWSTMAMVYPLVIPLSYAIALGDPNYDEMAIMANTIASVLAGSVLGDHCSPISDTTILSSLASSCDHIEHVRTQMPYALTVGVISLFVGVIPTALGLPNWIAFLTGISIMYLIIKYKGKKIPIMEKKLGS
ncbi:MAG: Na+/H+ antiporter NhaC family protein [Brumimicrobium sp.]